MLLALLTMVVGVAFCALYGSERVIKAIFTTRPLLDQILEIVRGGSGMGIGGGINLLVLGIGLKKFLHTPSKALPSAGLIWFPFLLSVLPAVLMSPWLGDAFRWYLTLVTYFCVFITPYYYIETETEFFKFMKLTLYGSLIPVFGAFFLPAHDFESEMRVLSTFTHPNILALYLVTVLFTCLYMLAELPEAEKKARKFIMIYVPIVLVALVMTKTRSAWVAAALLLCVYAFLIDRRWLILLGIGVVIAALTPSVVARLQDLTQGNINEDYAALNSYAWRLVLWESGLDWAKDHRWLGLGALSFRQYMPFFFPLQLEDGMAFDAHSTYVQLLFEAGYIGLTGFLLFLVALVTSAYVYRVRGSASYLLTIAAIAGYALASYSDNVMQYLVYNWGFFFAISAVLTHGRLVREKTASKQAEDLAPGADLRPAT